MNLGIIIVLVAACGYLSNFLNWRYLNTGAVRGLYYIGAFVHETSHAVFCLLTGANIERFTVFSHQPQVVHRKSRVPLVGELLISAAPIAGGILFLWAVNRYLLGGYFAASLSPLAGWQDWRAFLAIPLGLIAQVDFMQWQSWVMILLFFNVGAMLGPSPQDLKNVWPALILLLLVPMRWIPGPLVAAGIMALALIVVNIVLQVAVIAVFRTGAWLLAMITR